MPLSSKKKKKISKNTVLDKHQRNILTFFNSVFKISCNLSLAKVKGSSIGGPATSPDSEQNCANTLTCSILKKYKNKTK